MEIYIIILSAINILLIIFLIYIFLRKSNKNSSNTNNIVEINESLDKVKDYLRESLSNTLLNFDKRITDSLQQNMKSSTNDMSEYRLKTTNDFIDFQEKINKKLQEQFKILNDSVEQRMTLINNKVDERLEKGFEKSNETFKNIIERMAVIDKAQQNITTLSNEMMGLQQILTNNQARGSFGEYQLNQILFSAYGENEKMYKIQYTIREQKNKEAVRADAAVFMPSPHNVVCIDSKFPFSSYSKLFDEKVDEDEDKIIADFKKEVKKHINDISSKYIIEGITADYAIMFVASDGILALIHSKCPDIVELAQQKSVLIVSPTTIFPLLQTYRMLFIDYERSKNAKEISYQISLLNKEFGKIETDWDKINNNIGKLYQQSESFDKRVDVITKKFNKIKSVDFTKEEQVIEQEQKEEE